MAQHHVLKPYANGVMDLKGKFFPYKAVSGSFTDTQAILAAKRGVRYYLSYVTITCRAEAGLAVGSVAINLTVNNESESIVAIRTPTTPAADAGNYAATTTSRIQLLTDLNTAVTMAVTVVTSGNITLIYAEVDESEGEYQI